MDRVILSGSTQKVSIALLSFQCENHGVIPQVIPGLIMLEMLNQNCGAILT